ncbi:MAG: DUF192 domain-containing protein [Candidatus Omnitrophota bacterium]|jgi:hypothetical protein
MFWMILMAALAGFQTGDIQRVCFEDRCIKVEVVSRVEEQLRGLMFRDGLAEGTGMLFVYERDIRPVMYMKNMRFSLDLIWLDVSKTIVAVKKNVPACAGEPCPRYDPGRWARYVLEIPAGTVDRLRLKKGTQARFETEETRGG